MSDATAMLTMLPTFALEDWMQWNRMARLDEMRGRSSLALTRDPGAFERANYIRTLQSWMAR